MSIQARLARTLNIARTTVRPSAAALAQSELLPGLWPSFLFRTYAIARASIPLMRAAEVRYKESSKSSPTADHAIAYLHHHIEEELHHDEWLLEDLRSLGFDSSTVIAQVVPGTIASLVGAAHYWIKFQHPIALFGYMLALEGTVGTPGDVDEIQSRTGLPKAAFRTFREHATLDSDHANEILNVLERLVPSDREVSLVGTTLLHTAHLMAESFDDLLALAAGRTLAQLKTSLI